MSSEGRGRRMGTALRRALLLPGLAVLPGGSRPWGGRACFRGASCARLWWTATVAGEAEPVGLRGPFHRWTARGWRGGPCWLPSAVQPTLSPWSAGLCPPAPSRWPGQLGPGVGLGPNWATGETQPCGHTSDSGLRSLSHRVCGSSLQRPPRTCAEAQLGSEAGSACLMPGSSSSPC